LASRLYYNASSFDANTGRGYGKSQPKIPSIGTSQGSEYIMGSSETGIYSEPVEEYDEDEDYGFYELDDLYKFVRMINKDYVSGDSVRPRADMSSLGNSNNRFSTVGMGNTMSESDMPSARSGISPFSSKQLYPSGFTGPPLGTGGADQAFRTTGNFRRTGTQYGTSRAPILDSDVDNLRFLSAINLVNFSNDDINFLKQLEKVKKALQYTESLV